MASGVRSTGSERARGPREPRGLAANGGRGPSTSPTATGPGEGLTSFSALRRFQCSLQPAGGESRRARPIAESEWSPVCVGRESPAANACTPSTLLFGRSGCVTKGWRSSRTRHVWSLAATGREADLPTAANADGVNGLNGCYLDFAAGSRKTHAQSVANGRGQEPAVHSVRS